MTVCIAAACQESEINVAPRIVFCCDWRGEIPEVGSTDTVFKFRHLSDQWIALQAGNLSRSQELCIRLEEHLKTKNFTQANIADAVREVFNEYKKALADSYLRSTFAISLADLTTNGSTRFGSHFTETCLGEIAKINVGAELIIAGITDAFSFPEKKDSPLALICVVSESQEDPVTLETEFAVVGSGGDAAKTMLSFREQESGDSLMETVYSVYEAKRISETVPGVGTSFFLAVLYPDKSVAELSDDGYKRLKKLFSRFGPRSHDVKNSEEWFAFSSTYFEPLTEPELPESSPAPSETP